MVTRSQISTRYRLFVPTAGKQYALKHTDSHLLSAFDRLRDLMKQGEPEVRVVDLLARGGPRITDYVNDGNGGYKFKNQGRDEEVLIDQLTPVHKRKVKWCEPVEVCSRCGGDMYSGEMFEPELDSSTVHCLNCGNSHSH